MAFRSGLAVLLVLVASGTTFAGAQGKYFDCVLDDGTTGALNFFAANRFAATYEGTNGGGFYQETDAAGFVSVVNTTGSSDNIVPTYFGIFTGFVIDPSSQNIIVRRILARLGFSQTVIYASGIGNDFDPYIFSGVAR